VAKYIIPTPTPVGFGFFHPNPNPQQEHTKNSTASQQLDFYNEKNREIIG
jgi:hypothetical protein